MKQAFLICAVLFAAMWAGAQATLTHPPNDGVVRLKWATDPNPARTVQTRLFDTLYPGLQVSVNPSAGGDASKVIVQCATGTGPDIIDVYSVQQLQTLVSAGILLDLTPYARPLGFDPSHTYPAAKDSLEVGGKQYRFPCNVVADAVIYNKKIFEDHGVPYPTPGWTYADFVSTARMLLTRPSRSGQTHLAVVNWNNVGFYEDLLIGHGGHVFTRDGLHSALASPEALAALQDYHDMMYVDKILPTPADAAAMSSQGGWGTGGLNWFSEGKAAMIVIGRWYIVQLPNFPALRGNLGAVPLPRVPGHPSAGVADTRAAGINVKSPHWRQSLRFLQYLASPRYGAIIVQDGDGLPPDPHLALSGQALVNGQVADPAFHDAFVAAIRNARPLDTSPFVDAEEVGRWIQEYLEKVENRLLTPRQAMQTLATHVDQQIRLNLERRPDLQRLYEQRTGQPYPRSLPTPAWKVPGHLPPIMRVLAGKQRGRSSLSGWNTPIHVRSDRF